MVKFIGFIGLIGLLCVSSLAQATQPPTKKQLAQYKKDGTLLQKIDRARAYGNHKIDKRLVSRFQHQQSGLQNNQYQKKYSQIKSKSAIAAEDSPFSGAFPSIGTPRTLVLLVEFPEYIHKDINSREAVEKKIFGEGDPNDIPNDSLTQFYKRSSYNKVDIKGNVLEWYQTSYARPEDTGENSWEVKQQVIKDAITYHDEQGHDFSQYDNDGDGQIDYLSVIWTGPTGEWATLWWGTFSGYSDDSFVVDGKTLGGVSWQQISYDSDEGPFSPSTLIHETGHAMGLADYYDYDEEIGPKGGVGGIDQMDGGNDHNAFSKYLLGWLTPQVLGSGSTNIDLSASTLVDDALLIMPAADGNTKFDEFFIVESRTQQANDIDLINNGLLIWHVDATVNQWGWFKNDNSYSDDKFIRLVQADGLAEIEELGSRAGRDDFFTAGSIFSPNSIVQSRNNAQLHTGVAIENIKLADTANFDASVQLTTPDFTFNNLADFQVFRKGDVSSIVPSEQTNVAKIELFIDEQLMISIEDAPFTITWQDQTINLGSHKLVIKITDSAGNTSSEYRDTVYLNNEQSILLVSLGKRLEDQELALKEMLITAGHQVVTSHFMFDMTSADFSAVVVNYGSSYEKDITAYHADGTEYLLAEFIYRPASLKELEYIYQYLNMGGNLVVQGESVFATSTGIGLADALGVDIVQDNISAYHVFADIVYDNKAIHMSFDRSLESIGIDLLKAKETITDSTSILSISGNHWDWDVEQWLDIEGSCVLSHNIGSAKVVVSSCLTRRLDDYSQALLMNNYLAFFELDKRISLNHLPNVYLSDTYVIYERSSVIYVPLVTDEDNDTLTYSWQQLSGISIELLATDRKEIAFTVPEVTKSEILIFELTVNDGTDVVIKTMNITIENVNRAPTVSTEVDHSITEGDEVILSATSEDLDGDNLTYIWQQISGIAVELSATDSLTTSFVAPDVASDQSLVFELTVSDGLDSAMSSISIIIKDTVVAPVTSTATTSSSNSSSGGGSSNAYMLLMLLGLIVFRGYCLQKSN